MQIEREEGRVVVLTTQHAPPVKSSADNISIESWSRDQKKQLRFMLRHSLFRRLYSTSPHFLSHFLLALHVSAHVNITNE
ncbi:hypothetical protein EYF80_010088 [Liparis tanakae]|uniref:Uncharacterized protein n=1 Tax=Liparis tanakae TaxID=230148 RepID=A0A4Z2IQB7_9TELE|nr:hypothetical protein EYF80_010088 [Liparis tanakae]